MCGRHCIYGIIHMLIVPYIIACHPCKEVPIWGFPSISTYATRSEVFFPDPKKCGITVGLFWSTHQSCAACTLAVQVPNVLFWTFWERYGEGSQDQGDASWSWAPLKPYSAACIGARLRTSSAFKATIVIPGSLHASKLKDVLCSPAMEDQFPDAGFPSAPLKVQVWGKLWFGDWVLDPGSHLSLG